MGEGCSRCCNDRKKSVEVVAPTVTDAPLEGRKTAHSIRGLGLDVDSSVRPSILLGLEGRDAEDFDEAFANQDIQAFVRLLESEGVCGEGQIEECPEHAWASNPNTVGALAATQLAVIAQMDEGNVVTIRQAGAIPSLVKYLKKSVAEDKRDAAVVLLVFLTSIDAECCSEVGQRGASPDLVRILSDQYEHRGLRAAVSTILVNVILEHQGSASRFIREGWIVELLRSLDGRDAASKMHQEEPFYLEIIENVAELTEADATGQASRFMPSVRKAVTDNDKVLTRMARKFPNSEIEAVVSKIISRIS